MLAAALLMSGALVGVSFGGGGGITQPEEVKLEFDVFKKPAVFRFYDLREHDGRRSSQILHGKWPLFDVDGNMVGHMNETCLGPSVGPEGDTNEICTFVHKLKAGPNTKSGIVVTTGYQLFGGPHPQVGSNGWHRGLRERSRIRRVGPGNELHAQPDPVTGGWAPGSRAPGAHPRSNDLLVPA